MVRFKSFSPAAILLLPAFALLLLSVISAPITPFSSLGSAQGTKFGVFGYCFSNGTCSGIQVGYDSDDIISLGPGAPLSKRESRSMYASSTLVRRQNMIGNLNGNGGNFNLPSNARNGLSNILVVHVVAAALTLVLLVISLFGHLEGPSNSMKYMLFAIILFVPTIVLTLLAFLVDILLFVPNLDWGTWITLGATVLNALAGILICTSRRRLSSRNAMKARIAENDELNGESYYNSQHLQNPPTPIQPQMAQADKATIPKFAQFELDTLDSPDQERVPLTRRELDSRSVRSETASLTSPPHYPRSVGGGYTAPDRSDLRQAPQPYDQIEPPYGRSRIPYGNPPRQRHHESDQMTRDLVVDTSYGLAVTSDDEDVPIAAPLAHAPGYTADAPLSANAESERQTPWADGARRPSNRRLDQESQGDWNSAPQQPPDRRRQRVVSGPRPMPGNGPNPSHSQMVRSPSDSYYEDVSPQYDPQLGRNADDDFIDRRLSNHGSRRHTPQGSGSFDRPAYPQQPRSPDTLSNSSHFTSVSQRGINPQWRGDGSQQYGGMPQSQSQQSFTRGPRQGNRRPQQPNILADNPDFVLPGVGGRKRLPQSRRPGAIPGLSASNLSSGQSPYAVTKGL